MSPRRAAAALAVAVLTGAVMPVAAAGQTRARFDTRVFALVPAPGFPAMAYVSPDGRVYEGTYDNPQGSALPSRVLEYSGAGALMRSWTIWGQSLAGAQGVQVATSDARGRLILLDKTPPRVLALDPLTGTQTTLATFPTAATPNYAAWGPDGALYVTDYTEPIIWRIPPGGGTPEQWFTDPQLNGGMFGTTAILLEASRRSFLVGIQSEGGAATLSNPSTGRIFRLPVTGDGRPGALAQVWESGPADGPDGFGIARSGDIYVPLLVSDQIAELDPSGHELARFPSTPGSGDNGSPVPYDSPSSTRFLGTSLVIANQSYFQGNAAHQAILNTEVGEPGLPEYIPALPAGAAPAPAATPKGQGRAGARGCRRVTRRVGSRRHRRTVRRCGRRRRHRKRHRASR